MFFEAMIATASQMYKERKGKDKMGKIGKLYLQFVSVESVLQVAMMADAGDEHSLLLRFHDQEAFDLAQSARQAYTFCDRIQCLFSEEGCWRQGYTAYAVEMLKDPKVVFIDSEPKAIGGPGALTNDIKKNGV